MEYLLLYKLKQFKFIANWLIFFCAFRGGRRAIPGPLKGWVYGIEIRPFYAPNFADSGGASKGARGGRVFGNYRSWGLRPVCLAMREKIAHAKSAKGAKGDLIYDFECERTL